MATAAADAIAADDRDTEFFEQKIRPVLVEQCYGCHNSHAKTEGGLALDDRESTREGGTSGAAVVPGKPDESLLLKAIRHQKGSPRMPKGSAKLSDAVVADFDRWIRLGAPDPRDEPPSEESLKALTSWDAVRERRMKWWSFQPVRKPAPPAVRDASWSDHPIDRFILAEIERAGLAPAGPASRLTLLRRTTFALTGLPPTPDEQERFLRDDSPRAYEDLVDRLLASPRFGERWARHWMDWLRYTDSHGSEGDPSIPRAWRYRDYIIRALNDDIPYDRMVREHIAGDLLPDPRINRALQINESALATAHYRMVPHGYAPTDALEEQVTFTDNQVDVISKAFLGLTVSCARCHDHKFDPIGQADFYALYGILASCRPALITVDTPERSRARRPELERLRDAIKPRLAESWSRSLDGLVPMLVSPSARLREVLDEAATRPEHPLHPWTVLRNRKGADFASAWNTLRPAKADKNSPRTLRWDLRGDDATAWFKHGNGLGERPSHAGAFHILASGDQAIANIYPAGIYTHLLSNKHNGMLTSPRFKVESDEIAVRIAGGNNARVRLVVQNYPRAIGLIYPFYEPKSEDLRWYRWDTRYWKGEWAYLEIATSEDLPVEIKPHEGRSWFGVAAVAFLEKGQPIGSESPTSLLFRQSPPDSPEALARLYVDLLRECVAAWKAGAMTDLQAEFLGAFVRDRLLPNTLDALPQVAPLIAEYRECEADVPVPTRSPGVLEGTVFDQPLFARGNPKKPGDPVPRRFLEAFDATPYVAKESGRLELAKDLTRPGNPLTSRIIVNRLWHHLFGRGIVATTDNFGHLGDRPTHPELLDDLAARFVAEGWSIKRMIRFMVTSKTYQLSSHASAEASERDPSNQTLSHFPVRRLEAEAIRDAILAVSGQLDETRYGPDIPGRHRRRSVYGRVQRNELDPFLTAFDAPEPVTTRGRRDATNVPAQSLMLLNDPWVIDQARRWAEKTASGDATRRITGMFRTALGRPPTPGELEQCRGFLGEQAQRVELARREIERLESEIRSRRERMAALTAPARSKVLARNKRPGPRDDLPTPLARWEFETDLRDAVGKLHGEAEGGARLDGGALVVDGHSFVRTPPLPRPVVEKTLEAWVTVDDPDQRGGGVISLETLNGSVFDAIVFGEMEPRHWMAGSDFFRRTRPFAAPPEESADSEPVHLALVYRRDGTITAYRQGVPYGTKYQTEGPVRFVAGSSHVVFGLRHSPAGGNKMFRGRIHRASLYDRALSGDEVAASASSFGDFVAEKVLVASLTSAERSRYEQFATEVAQLEATLRRHDQTARGTDDAAAAWQALAHAMLNFKEFLYIQ